MTTQTPKLSADRAVLHDLKTHPEPYVTIAQLSEYWRISRKQLYKHIDAGTLPAIRLGPRLVRIRTSAAFEFERRANMHHPIPHSRTAEASPQAVKVGAQSRRR